MDKPKGDKMLLELYKVAKGTHQDTMNEFFESVEIMDETDLRNFFATELPQMDKQVLQDHDINPGIHPTEQFVELCDIVDILNSNDTYNDHATHYYVEQVDVQIHE